MSNKGLPLNKENIRLVLLDIISQVLKLPKNLSSSEIPLGNRNFMPVDTTELATIDSLDKAEIIIDIENAFYFDIPDNTIESLSTFEDLYSYICHRTESETLPIDWQLSF
jgi:acyl carrier protein